MKQPVFHGIRLQPFFLWLGWMESVIVLRYQWVSNRILSGAHQSLSSRREKQKFENFCEKQKFENFCEKQKFEKFCWWGGTWGTGCVEIRNPILCFVIHSTCF